MEPLDTTSIDTPLLLLGRPRLSLKRPTRTFDATLLLVRLGGRGLPRVPFRT